MVPICVIVLFLCLFLTCTSVSFEQMKRLDNSDKHRYWVLFKQNKCACLICLSWLIVSCGIMIGFAYSSLNLMFYLVTGLYLNGSFFIPMVVPLLVLLVYAWNTWKSCLEIEYWQLKAKICEVCEEYCEKSTSSSSSTTSLSQLVPSYTVNVKEGTLSKALDDKVRENILPYSQVFFNFFVRMCFIDNFSLVACNCNDVL